MLSCIFTDNLNCRGMWTRMRSVKACLDQVHAAMGTARELTVLDRRDRILAFIPTRTTSGKLMVWDYRTNEFRNPRDVMKSGAIFAASVASDEMQEAFRLEVLAPPAPMLRAA